MIPVFLKWAGGKRRIIDELEKKFPEKIERYFEPFLGAGAVFFYVKKKYNPKFCQISDINKDLVDTYIAVRDRLDLLAFYLKKYKENNSEKFYYEIRKKFNDGKIRGVNRSAAFIYLNKTCFNGLYRVNSKNEFNVPYGKNKNAIIFDRENLAEASKLLQGVVIKCQDYREILNDAEEGDFVYLDPCYDPIKKTSFANYTSERFTESHRIDLHSFIKKLDKKRTNLLLSNNNIKEVRLLYLNFNVSKILVPRPINSIVDQRGKIEELLIKNY